jgi:hypothetical protein
MADLLVAGSSDGRLGFIDVKSARLLHVRPVVSSRIPDILSFWHGRFTSHTRHV